MLRNLLSVPRPPITKHSQYLSSQCRRPNGAPVASHTSNGSNNSSKDRRDIQSCGKFNDAFMPFSMMSFGVMPFYRMPFWHVLFLHDAFEADAFSRHAVPLWHQICLVECLIRLIQCVFWELNFVIHIPPYLPILNFEEHL